MTTKIKIHSTAIIEDGVEIGEGTSVWDNVHIRHGARIGEECIVGEKSYIAYDVVIGNCVKINAFVYICAAVTIEDGVMISAGTIFTNDRFPRATAPDLKSLRPSEPDEHTLPTLVKEGATIGAGCVIGNDLSIGRWAMVGMGSVVTKSVPDFHLVIGNPARSIGAVCKCGQLFHKFDDSHQKEFECDCGLRYEIESKIVKELNMKKQGDIWKHGCNWNYSKNSFYNFIKRKQIVIVGYKLKIVPNDLVMITEGFKVKAIVQIEEEPIKITENSEYAFLFDEYNIPFEDWVYSAKAEWYELPEEKIFQYKVQKGAVKVHKTDIKEKVLDLWNNR